MGRGTNSDGELLANQRLRSTIMSLSEYQGSLEQMCFRKPSLKIHEKDNTKMLSIAIPYIDMETEEYIRRYSPSPKQDSKDSRLAKSDNKWVVEEQPEYRELPPLADHVEYMRTLEQAYRPRSELSYAGSVILRSCG